MNIGGHKTIASMLSIENSSGERIALQETKSEKDLGVIVNSKLKWDDQDNQAFLKATSVLGMLKRTFVHWSSLDYIQLMQGPILSISLQSGTLTERRTLDGSGRSKKEILN